MTAETQNSDSAAMRFEILRAAVKDGAAARVGRLAFAGRTPIDTPNFIGTTSRGALPHLTPDTVGKHLQVTGAYMALEDFIERPQQYLKRIPPIYSTPTTAKHHTRLHSFTAMPQSVTTVLSARRLPAVPSPMGNTNASVSVFTSTGFQILPTKEYLSAVQALEPDIAIPPADLTHSPITPNSKRALRMAERTDEWVVEWFSELADANSRISTFAPILPISYSIQWEYISRLAEDYLPTAQLSGLAIYDADLVPDLADHCAALLPLPRLSLANPPTPHHILRQIALGIDLFTLPFINTISDAGLALSFSFPPPDTSSSPTTNGSSSTRSLQPLAIDLSLPHHATAATTPLSPNCTCHACTAHHSAYVHHLLAAREMLGWTLLQIHNHAVVSAFFAGVRDALLQGDIKRFEEGARQFALAYEPEFPEGVGQKPRARGYQYKSVGDGEARRNKAAWGKLEGGEGEGEGAGEKGEKGV
ncbi:tRNA-guanine(15) transglycosylase-like protein [Chaetomidium leptoderma]|uniref:Queuine tRNA-ribosyltransferase accessory subunit 2 n=1 Tax=Chaetomidium leptoderma TaxID=669021 RepID=A0AAN6VNM5_9PEZI|nr:tRNA-guanine(15) transglycosylase-like protein [Chaetomidium leptoderma]